MGAAGAASPLGGPLLLLGLPALLVLSCPAQDFLFRPGGNSLSRAVADAGQLSSCSADLEAAAGRLSYLLGAEGKEHLASWFPWTKGGKVIPARACAPLSTPERVHAWAGSPAPARPGSCRLPQNYADLVMVAAGRAEVRCTQEGCCSRGLCHLQGWSLPARKTRESPQACHEKGGPDSGSAGFEGVISKRCEGGDVFCGRLLCAEARLLPVLPDRSVILNLATKSGIVCWGTDYYREMVAVHIPDVEKVKECGPCGEGFLCFNRTCQPVSVFKVDCVSDKCIREGVCRGHRNCRCKQGREPPSLRRAKSRESSDSPSPTKWKKPRRKSVLSAVIFHMRFFLLIVSMGLAILAKMIAVWLT